MADFDPTKLKQRGDVKRQRLGARVSVTPSRAQTAGPITKGPRAYEHCSTCSRMLSTPERELRIGVPKQLVRQHLKDHQMGRIRKPR